MRSRGTDRLARIEHPTAVKAGTLTPHIDGILQLEEVALQYEYLESRRSTGKLLIDLRG